MGIPFQSWLMLIIGFLFGALIASKDFRTKFFKSFRSFIGQIGKGAQEQDQRTKDDLRRMNEGMQQQGRQTMVGRKPPSARKDNNDRYIEQ